MSEPNLHMPRIPNGSPRYQEGYSEGYRKAVQDTKGDNDRLRARVAELEGALQPFTDPDNAPLMVLSDAWMAQLVDNARAVRAKGREA